MTYEEWFKFPVELLHTLTINIYYSQTKTLEGRQVAKWTDIDKSHGVAKWDGKIFENDLIRWCQFFFSTDKNSKKREDISMK